MSLPSQSRSFGSRSSRKRRRRKGPPAAVFIVPLVLLGLVGLWWIMGGGTGASNEIDPTALNEHRAETTGSLAAITNDLQRDATQTPERPGIEAPRETTQSRAEAETDRQTQAPDLNERSQTPIISDPVAQNNTSSNASPSDGWAEQGTSFEEPSEDPFEPAAQVADMLEQATGHLNRGELVSARAVLNDALRSSQATESDRRRIREDLTTINQELFFGSSVYPGDALSEMYEIQSGDSLARITKNQSLTVDWRLVQRVNRISNPSRIRVGQKIKLVRGPIHAVVTKRDYRIDLYAGPPDDESQWTFLCSYPVGLGEDNSTPIGEFVVRSNSKLINPVWRNPRTGEHFAADDPENPIGERWIGIEGVGNSAVHEGYGIHGTIDPGSIGTDASMGCIRMNDNAVEVIYEMLVEQVSRVIVKP
ncbi:MAG: LysM peptidoglycan-binding domain-containing protein [Phycisphaera sp.]|nr:MAG: LysM peptidoglycan-binding domain-containing protein [Phycisphaera sp.]